MSGPVVGFDSVLFERRMIETPEKVFKAFMSAAITVDDEKKFRVSYDESLNEIFKERGIRRKKTIYKAHHLLCQAQENTSEIICDLLGKISELISHIDVYCGFYDLDDISIYGEASGQVIKRMTFLERNQHSFHHVCAWKYLKDYGTGCTLKMDHFSGERTPAWIELSSAMNMEIYYKGCECDPLISTSDLVLKLIQLKQHGAVTGRSIFDPIRENCAGLSGYRKLNYHQMKSYLRMTTPITPLPMDLKRFIKHPIFFILWNPEAPRNRVKPMFEWSPTYNAIAKKAYEETGCFKFISPEEDHLFWDCEKDFLIAWSEVDEEMVEWMRRMDFEIPKVLKRQDLVTKR